MSWPERHFRFLLVIGLIALSPVSQAENPLTPFLWKNRVLIVNTVDDVTSIESRLHVAREYIVDRDIVWIVLSDGDYVSNQELSVSDTFSDDLKRTYFKQDKRHVVLVGKDGGVKRRSQALDLVALFELIDSMPMRRREMQD